MPTHGPADVPIRGPLDHIDLSIRDPERSIPFYEALFTALGFERLQHPAPAFQEPQPTRAAWRTSYAGGGVFEVEVRPSAGSRRGEPHDRYAPGLHHLAFHAESRADVDAIHEALCKAGASVLDPPMDYGGQRGYSAGYYAVFFADPDGLKLEVAHIPENNP